MSSSKFTMNALLAIRIIPVRANFAFGIPAAIAGLAVRAVCLYLVIRDLKAANQ